MDSLAPMEEGHFDYTALGPEIAEFAKAKALKIEALRKQAFRNFIDIGICLKEVRDKFGSHAEKSHLRGEDTWAHWVRDETGFSKSHANTLIRIAEKLGGRDFGHPLSIDVLIYLSRRSTPEAAVDAVLDRARDGQRVTLPEAKRIAASKSTRLATKLLRTTPRPRKLSPQNRSALDGYEKKHGHHPCVSHSKYIRILWAVQEIAQEESSGAEFSTEMQGRTDRWSIEDAQKLPSAIQFLQEFAKAWEDWHGIALNQRDEVQGAESGCALDQLPRDHGDEG